MRRQRGITLFGFILIAIVVVLLAVLGMKVGPSYFEYYKIQKIFRAIAGNPELASATAREVQSAFDRYSAVEDIKAIGASDIEVSRDGGVLTISASYSVKVPIAGNVSACLDFRPTTER